MHIPRQRRRSELKFYVDSPRTPTTTTTSTSATGFKTLKKFPLLSKNFVIEEEQSRAEKMGIDDAIVLTLPERNQQTEFRFPTGPKKRVEIVETKPTYVTTTSFDVADVRPTKGADKVVKPPRMKDTMGIYENAKSGVIEANKSESPHYSVKNTLSGEMDVYAMPTVKLSPKAAEDQSKTPSPKMAGNLNLTPISTKMAGNLNLTPISSKMAGNSNLNLFPPELPPRNTPQPSPRSSALLDEGKSDSDG